MKGLLKGLRYISEIFEAENDKEPEIQIGAPTDVKHVAHIGCDGPSSSAPTWMNEFQGSSDGTSDSMKTPDRHGKSKQSRKQGSNISVNSSDSDAKPRKKTLNDETSHGRRAKNSTTESELGSQESGAKKNRRKKRTSSRDPSIADETN
ncbi:uncharacterized protein LOC143637731 [Bidens hawaiensis]|uniref:uncharacterized protein LOC143637731 n=1 Tax=Bidens hawaiensis TaxID=980011 RepID=UPI00404A0B35